MLAWYLNEGICHGLNWAPLLARFEVALFRFEFLAPGGAIENCCYGRSSGAWNIFLAKTWDFRPRLYQVVPLGLESVKQPQDCHVGSECGLIWFSQ